jgi:hypothetical protein
MAKTPKRGGKSGAKNLTAKDARSLRGGSLRNLGAGRADLVKGGAKKRGTKLDE